MARAIKEKNHKNASIFWVHVAAIFAVTAWGISFINTKVLLNNDFSPVEVYIFRCIIAYILLLAFSWRTLRSHNLQHELLFLLCGICGGSIYFVSENAALIYTSATNVSLITSTSPLINALLVILLYKDERPTVGFMLGSLVAMIGVILVIIGSSVGENTSAEMHGLLGDGLSLMAAICWSIYALLLRKLQAFYNALTVTRKTFFYGLITALPFLLLQPSNLSLDVFTRPQVWINLLILALIASSLSFIIWAWAISKIGAVKAGNYLYFQPVVTMIFGYLVLHQNINYLGIIGCVLTIIGVYCGERLSKEHRRIAH